jgi:hypothetical protein
VRARAICELLQPSELSGAKSVHPAPAQRPSVGPGEIPAGAVALPPAEVAGSFEEGRERYLTWPRKENPGS